MSALRLPSGLISSLLPGLLVVMTCSCGTSYHWQSIDKQEPFEDLWFEVARLAGTHGFAPNHALTDRGKRVYVSVWREYPAPFRFGRRSRFKAQFLPKENGKGWRIEFYIQQQVVKDMAHGFNPGEGDWSDSGQDVAREQVILGQLRLFRNRSHSSRPESTSLDFVTRAFDQPQERSW